MAENTEKIEPAVESNLGIEVDVATYYSLIGLCEKGEVEKGKETLRSMIFEDDKPNAVTCNSLLDVLCKKGEIDMAKELLNEMIFKGHEPNAAIYNIPIDRSCNY
jgi:pentatricopeptide repeat protein